jgi:N-acyl-D-amino-acid deacylase
MNAQFDHVIRNALVADGTGADLFEADVAVSGGKIAAIGKVTGGGAEETDARGRLLTPGFVDIHTHYDGQVTWDNRLLPSSNHGVTTVVMGNCGVGFAPCRAEDRERLVRVMEGVEDIPEVVMTAGIPWKWESFPDYLSFLQERKADIDFAAQIPHAAVRVNVMGERGANREPATEEELAQMTRIVAEGIRAGGIGVSTSRSIGHRTADGELAPTVHSAVTELEALARGLGEAGSGVFQLIAEQIEHVPEDEVAMLRRLTKLSGRPLSFTLMNGHQYPDYWQRYLRALEAVNAPGLPPIRGQVYPRPVGIILGLDLSFHPFRFNPSYLAIAHLPLAERVQAMRDPELRAKILAERPQHANMIYCYLAGQDAELFCMDEIPDYEPQSELKVGALAATRGMSPRELIYDLILESDGLVTFMLPAINYPESNLEPVREMMEHPHTLIGLGDGGAHYGMISDGSYPTTLLALWTRDRKRGPKISLPRAVQMLTRPNAEAVGLTDRGLVKTGYKADLNLIDYDRLALHRPRAVWDLPAGGRRLIQKADGYAMTMVSGDVTYINGEFTGVLPGRLVRNSASRSSLSGACPVSG